MTLSLTPGAGQINGTSQLPEQVLSGITVLLAEDNLFNQKLIVKLLRGYGADCLVANNGLEAIEIAGDLHIDVVLMDIHMPVVDGVTACEAIMEQSGDSLPIIGLTADYHAYGAATHADGWSYQRAS